MHKYKDLQTEWYQKIKDDGFLDIEYPSAQLKLVSPNFTSEKILTTQRYYSICSDFLHKYHFNSDLDREIWQLHSEGFSLRQTAKILKIGHEKTRYRLNKLKIILDIWRKM